MYVGRQKPFPPTAWLQPGWGQHSANPRLQMTGWGVSVYHIPSVSALYLSASGITKEMQTGKRNSPFCYHTPTKLSLANPKQAVPSAKPLSTTQPLSSFLQDPETSLQLASSLINQTYTPSQGLGTWPLMFDALLCHLLLAPFFRLTHALDLLQSRLQAFKLHISCSVWYLANKSQKTF